MVYYRVGWMLRSWVNYSEHTVCFDDDGEAGLFVSHLKTMVATGKIVSYTMTPAVVPGYDGAIALLEEDIAQEGSRP